MGNVLVVRHPFAVRPHHRLPQQAHRVEGRPGAAEQLLGKMTGPSRPAISGLSPVRLNVPPAS